MATNFFLRTNQKNGLATLFTRVRSRKFNVDLKISTNIEVDVEKWNNAQLNTTKQANFKRSAEGKQLYSLLDKITASLDSAIVEGFNSDDAREIVDGIYYAEERKAEVKRIEDNNKVTLNDYINTYLEDITTGKRQTPSGGRYAANSIKSTKQSFTKLKEYQANKHKVLNFEDVDIKFYRDFSAYLMAQDYSINTIGKVFKDIKTLMQAALSDELHTNIKFQDKSFKASKVEVDSIYLTESDLKAIIEVDLSKLDKCYSEARDIFLVGCYLAQRVSDYNNLTKENLKASTIKVIEEDKIVEKTLYTINLIQQKTKARVSIPVKAELLAIFKKYDYTLPKMYDQKINEYIKKVGELAGLTELIEIVTTKGGKPVTESFPKYSLIHTHTARRTGATLMYLSGMQLYDIMKITGHSSPKMLQKYIKADTLEAASKIAEKYDYFN